MLGEERRAGKRQRRGAIAVEHGVNLFRRWSIRSSHHVIPEQGHPNRPPLAGNVVNGVSRILLSLGGNRLQIPGHAVAVDVAEKDLGKGDRPIRSERIRHAMQAEGYLVQVPFEFKTGGVNERLILRVVRQLVPVKMGSRAQRAEIEIENAVRFGQQSGHFGWRLAVQVRSQAEQHENEQNDEDGRLGAPGHSRRES